MISPYAYVGMRDAIKKEKPTPEEIIKFVCKYLNIPEQRIYQKTRERQIVFARQVIYAAIRTIHPLFQLKRIARMFNQDHTTIIHGIKVIENYVDVLDDSGLEYKRILNLLK